MKVTFDTKNPSDITEIKKLLIMLRPTSELVKEEPIVEEPTPDEIPAVVEADEVEQLTADVLVEEEAPAEAVEAPTAAEMLEIVRGVATNSAIYAKVKEIMAEFGVEKLSDLEMQHRQPFIDKLSKLG